jgi:hypothetical protein
MYNGVEAWGGINENVGGCLRVLPGPLFNGVPVPLFPPPPAPLLQGWISVLFFCGVIILGKFVLLNVFLVRSLAVLCYSMFKARRHGRRGRTQHPYTRTHTHVTVSVWSVGRRLR